MSITDTQSRLLSTTRRLLLERGLQATSMSVISKEAKVATGSIYHLYSGKEALINAVYVDSRDRLLQEFPACPIAENDCLECCVKRQCCKYITSSLRHPEDFQFVMQYHMAPIIDRKNLYSADVNFVPGHTLTSYIESGELKPLTPVQISYILLGILNQMISAHFSNVIELDDDTIAATADACWDAIRNQETSQSKKNRC